MFENLLTHTEGGIHYIMINRPAKLNALNKATLAELHTAVYDALRNERVGGLIITGAGEKAFAAGADIRELAACDGTQAEELSRKAHKNVFNLIESSSKPVLAAINGFALGGGLELALACHIRIAAEDAKMGLPEVTLGLIPGYGGTQRLTGLVGKGIAMELILTGRMVSAGQARQYGLVNEVVAGEELGARAEALMRQILDGAPTALESAIRAVNAACRKGIDGFEQEIELFAKCFDTEDFREGTNAFLEKRKPVFKGR